MTGTEISPYEGGQLADHGPQVMTPEAALELDRQVRACTKAVLRDGTDYGVIPHTDGKKVLFKSGAEKLMQWFGYSYSCDRLEVEYDAENRKEGVTYRASVVKRLPGGKLMPIATCDGYAGYDEDKFYQSAEQARARAKDREEFNAERYDRKPNPRKWMTATEHRAPWNTVIKMAQKRAIVGAVINATAAGGLFTIDDPTGDMPGEDAGPSWYQRGLGLAADVTSQEEGDDLHRKSAAAVLSGHLTPDQATHIQNRISKRLKQLAGHIQVDVTDLTSTSPAKAEPPSAAPADAQGAGEASVPPAEHAPGSRPSRGQRSAGGTAKWKPGELAKTVGDRLTELGAEGDSDRVVLAAEILRLDDIPAALDSLPGDQLQYILTITSSCGTLAEVKALVEDGVAPEGGDPQ